MTLSHLCKQCRAIWGSKVESKQTAFGITQTDGAIPFEFKLFVEHGCLFSVKLIQYLKSL